VSRGRKRITLGPLRPGEVRLEGLAERADLVADDWQTTQFLAGVGLAEALMVFYDISRLAD
jgi:hypothetical protein